MGPDPKFLRRLLAQSARLLEQETAIEQWRVVVICPHRRLNFGSPTAVAEFVRERAHWLELETAAKDPAAPPLLRALAFLAQPEEESAASSGALQAEVASPGQGEPIAAVIAATEIARFNGRPIAELCAMGGITLEDFSQSVAWREIFGQGRLEGRKEGRQEGRQQGGLRLTLRQLRRRCGDLRPELKARVRALPLERLEALAEALLDFNDGSDLAAWLDGAG